MTISILLSLSRLDKQQQLNTLNTDDNRVTTRRDVGRRTCICPETINALLINRITTEYAHAHSGQSPIKTTPGKLCASSTIHTDPNLTIPVGKYVTNGILDTRVSYRYASTRAWDDLHLSNLLGSHNKADLLLFETGAPGLDVLPLRVQAIWCRDIIGTCIPSI